MSYCTVSLQPIELVLIGCLLNTVNVNVNIHSCFWVFLLCCANTVDWHAKCRSHTSDFRTLLEHVLLTASHPCLIHQIRHREGPRAHAMPKKEFVINCLSNCTRLYKNVFTLPLFAREWPKKNSLYLILFFVCRSQLEIPVVPPNRFSWILALCDRSDSDLIVFARLHTNTGVRWK